MSGKKIVISLICIISLIALVIGIIYKTDINKERTFYATVIEVSKEYILVKPLPGEKIRKKADMIIIHTNETYKVDDSILVYYKGEVPEVNPSPINVLKIELIGTKISNKKDEIDDKENSDEIENNSSNDVNNKQDSVDNNATTNSNDGNNNETNNYTEEDVIKYFDDRLNEVSNYEKTDSYKEKAKKIFTTTVDFLFYDGEIKGHTFKDLSSTAKLKILSIAFNIDNKINEKFPDYKNELSSKYHDAKDRIVAKYLEITVNVCANHDEYCDKAKEVWGTIKEKAGISWNTIKKYASSGISNIKEWYEVYSSK